MPRTSQTQPERRGERALSRTSHQDYDRGMEDLSWGKLLGGSALFLYGLFKRRGLSRLIFTGAGAGLVYREISDKDLLDGGFARLALHTKATRPVEVTSSVTVDRPIEEVFSFWRRLENLPRFFQHIESVQETSHNRSHWVAKLPAGIQMEWQAELIEDRENELLVWRSVEGTDIYNEGFIAFHPAFDGKGTEVHARIIYRPPAGEVGARVASFLSAIPTQVIKEDLRSFKQLLEAGEVPSIEGQPSGRSEQGNGRTDRLM